MATRKEREEVDALLRSMGAQPQMVRQTREAAKGASARNRAKAAQYKTLRELARKRKLGAVKDMLSAEAQRLMDEQQKVEPVKDDRSRAQKGLDKAEAQTRAEFRAATVKSVRRQQREKPEQERKAKAKAEAEAKRKAEQQKKARKLAQSDKATMMMERQRKRGEASRSESSLDASEGKKRVSKSRRLTRRQMELLKGDPEARARLEQMVGKGIVSKTTRRKTGPRQEEDPAEERKAKSGQRKAKRGGRKPASKKQDAKPPAKPKETTERWALPAGPEVLRGRSGLSKSEFLALSKAKQNKVIKESLSDERWDRWKKAGVDAATEAGWEILGTLLTGGLGLGASVVMRGVRTIGKQAAKKGAEAIGKEGVKQAGFRAKRAAESVKRNQKRQARNAKQRERRRAAKEAREKAKREAKEKAEREAREKAEREAKERARKDRNNERARERRRRQREEKEKQEAKDKSGSGNSRKTGSSGSRETGTGSGRSRQTGNTGRQRTASGGPRKQQWQKDRDARGRRRNARQDAARKAKARAWTKSAANMTEKQLRKIYDILNLGIDRGPSSKHGLEALKQYIAEAIRAGAPI